MKKYIAISLCLATLTITTACDDPDFGYTCTSFGGCSGTGNGSECISDTELLICNDGKATVMPKSDCYYRSNAFDVPDSEPQFGISCDRRNDEIYCDCSGSGYKCVNLIDTYYISCRNPSLSSAILCQGGCDDTWGCLDY